MTEVVPAIMPDSLEDLRQKMSRVVKRVPLVQLDIMDGLFVEPRTWPYTTGGPQELQSFVDEEEGFPYWDQLNFSVDLMICDPLSRIPDWITAGAARVIVHVEGPDDLEKTVIELQPHRSPDDLGLGVELGLAIGTNTSRDVIDPFLDQIDIVQCMGIETIGYSGEPLDERVLDTIRYFKRKAPNIRVSVDGGVTLNTAPRLIEAGADILVSQSAIFKSDDIVETIEQLRAL